MSILDVYQHAFLFAKYLCTHLTLERLEFLVNAVNVSLKVAAVLESLVALLAVKFADV